MPRRRESATRRGKDRRTASPLPEDPVEVSTGTVELRSDSDGVMLLLDGVESSHLDLDDPRHLVFEYMQQMMAVMEVALPSGDGLRAIHLGAAGCALPRAVEALWPDSRQVAVEVDPVLAARVREWFDLPRAPRLRIRVGDGRAELVTFATGGADVVVRDAFSGREVPAHLRTAEMAHEAADRLRPGGLYLANTADSPPLREARREAAAVAGAFTHAAVVAEPGVLRGRRYGNLVLVGSHRPLPVAALTRSLRTLPVPATLVHGAALEDFVAGAAPFTDPPPEPSEGLGGLVG